jgi:hypothetical protein
MLFQFLFMILNNSLTDQFSSLDSSLVNDYFMVLSELNFIVLDSLIKRVIFTISAFFDVMNDLK